MRSAGAAEDGYDKADARMQFARMPLDLGDDPAWLGSADGPLAEAGVIPMNHLRWPTDRALEQIRGHSDPREAGSAGPGHHWLATRLGGLVPALCREHANHARCPPWVMSASLVRLSSWSGRRLRADGAAGLGRYEPHS